MQNYIIVYSLPKPIEEKIRKAYLEVFNKPLPIKNLHLTLLPPFSLIEKDGLNKIKAYLRKNKILKINASISTPNLFVNPGETILYLPVEPKKEISKFYEKLSTFSKDLIKIETSLYHTDEIPPFLPHISLNYDFTFNSKSLTGLSEKLDNVNFILSKPTLMIKNASGSWETIT